MHSSSGLCIRQCTGQPAPPPVLKTTTKNCFLRSEPLAFAEATIMKNNLPIDNPLKMRPQAAAKRPALPIPVRFISVYDLRPFVAEDFVEALLGLDE